MGQILLHPHFSPTTFIHHLDSIRLSPFSASIDLAKSASANQLPKFILIREFPWRFKSMLHDSRLILLRIRTLNHTLHLRLILSTQLRAQISARIMHENLRAPVAAVAALAKTRFPPVDYQVSGNWNNYLFERHWSAKGDIFHRTSFVESWS